MDIKDVKVGGIYYIPVEVISVDDEVQAYYAKRKEKGLWDDFDAVDMVTKEEVVGTEIDDRIDFWKRDSESAHEEIRKLQEQVKRLEDSKACDERYDARVDLVTARAIINPLQEENKKLKQELKDAEASYNVVADTSLERKNRVTTMEEVIVALVEKIRRLEGGET